MKRSTKQQHQQQHVSGKQVVDVQHHYSSIIWHPSRVIRTAYFGHSGGLLSTVVVFYDQSSLGFTLALLGEKSLIPLKG